jgi:hypothetical protein
MEFDEFIGIQCLVHLKPTNLWGKVKGCEIWMVTLKNIMIAILLRHVEGHLVVHWWSM